MEIIKRKGSRSIKDIPKDILESLNNGTIETANLVEWLAVKPTILLTHFLKTIKRTKYLNSVLNKVDVLQKQTINTVNQAIGEGLLEQSLLNKDEELLKLMATHTSDCIRCWATYTIGKNEKLNIEAKLAQIQIFAADMHFGVREIAWLALREAIAMNLLKSIAILTTWTKSKDANIRRFASEATRPRGVWCAHIEILKKEPELALSILEPLKSDASKYVQDSVGNWLNDASKTNPKFVLDICKRWEKESKTKETNYIIKKALRTINK